MRAALAWSTDMPKLALASASVLTGLFLFAACAVGTEDQDIDQGVTPTVPTEAGTDPGEYKAPPPASTGMTPQQPRDAGTPPRPDAAPEAGPVTGVSCAAPTSCSGGEDLGSVTGDDSTVAASSRTVTRTGSTGAWFKLRVTEDVSFIFPYDLKVKADLIGPPTGAGNEPNFSLYLYAGSTTSDNACSAAPRAASGSSQSIALTIPDTLSVTDSRDVYVEVRETGHVGSNVCKPSSTWSLTVTGAE